MESEDNTLNTDTHSFKKDMQTLVEHEMFDTIVQSLFPDSPKEEVKQLLLATEDIKQFQSTFMYRACQWVVESSMTDFTYSGTEHLSNRPSLFISNHRDIVLDAMMLQYILVEKGLETTHVVIGSNLFEVPVMPLLARLNKMYSIGRGGNRREYYLGLMTMSQQLRQWVTVRGESVWVAQRNGRTKDGIDHTNPALVKMIASSGAADDPVGALEAMHITPVSVSYEWEPCAALKAREMCLSQQGSYTKAPGEDTQSVLSGIMDFKGHVHFTICPPLSHDELAATEGNSYAVAALIDRRIADGYHQWQNNHIARQMLQGTDPGDTPAVHAFEQYSEEACRRFPLGDELRHRLLGIYAGATQYISHLRVKCFLKSKLRIK